MTAVVGGQMIFQLLRANTSEAFFVEAESGTYRVWVAMT